MLKDPTGWRDRLRALSTIDWTKKNRDWENVNMVANSVVSDRQARVATRAYLKDKLGLEISNADVVR